MILRVNTKNPQRRLLEQASRILKNGGVIIYPTDTVYGMGCDLYSKKGLDKLKLIKPIEKKHPLTLLVPDIRELSKYAALSNFAFHALKRSVPGPYTFLLPAARTVSRTVLGKKKIAGFRIPDNRVIIELLKIHGNPIVNTSVTTDTGEVQDPDYIYDEYGKRVDCVIDGGIVRNTPSSIIDLSRDEIVILREGESPFWSEARG